MSVKILTGDCRTVLRAMTDESVHSIVTSPPYFGLRDYGTAKWDGGDSECQHRVGNQIQDTKAGGAIVSGVRPGTDASTCKVCGARRIDSQIGLEPTPAEFVAELVDVFRECRRVMRRDATLWLNLGDSYASKPAGANGYLDGRTNRDERTSAGVPSGLKPKDLIGIPWRVAFALQTDGWYLRSSIIWHKPNPMPESVTDRPTSAHENIFLFSRSERYFYDAEAVREAAAYAPAETPKTRGRTDYAAASGVATRPQRDPNGGLHSTEFRNLRNVWTVATQPFGEAHFATFPPALIEPCIKAGCPQGGTVLDPFGGAGTTGLVADRLGRNAVLIELNPEYAAMARRRIEGDGGMFASVNLEAAE